MNASAFLGISRRCAPRDDIRDDVRCGNYFAITASARFATAWTPASGSWRPWEVDARSLMRTRAQTTAWWRNGSAVPRTASSRAGTAGDGGSGGAGGGGAGCVDGAVVERPA